MLTLGKTRRTIALTAATIAAAAALATGTGAGAANATTSAAKPTIQTSQRMVLTHLPKMAAHGTATTACGVNLINIGQPGNVYGTGGHYVGQVEQMYDTSCHTVWAHFAWDSWYMANYSGDKINVVVSSPSNNGAHYAIFWNIDTRSKDWYVGNLDHAAPSPDSWRAGAQWNNNGCVAWGTLHWYAGQDLSGPTATCGGNWWVAPN